VGGAQVDLIFDIPNRKADCVVRGATVEVVNVLDFSALNHRCRSIPDEKVPLAPKMINVLPGKWPDVET
jgi:hypothetical protein